jgi:hypothetical protein
MNNYNNTMPINIQPSCAAISFNPTPVQQFVMKPVIPEITTHKKKSILPSIVFTNSRDEQQPQLLSRINEIFNPSNRRLSGGDGGGTEFTAMLAKPSTKANIAAAPAAAYVGENNKTDEASMSKISDLGQSAHSETDEKDTISVNGDDTKSTVTMKSTTSVVSQGGRGFGAKNLAAMKARMSIIANTTSSANKTPSSDLERK